MTSSGVPSPRYVSNFTSITVLIALHYKSSVAEGTPHLKKSHEVFNCATRSIDSALQQPFARPDLYLQKKLNKEFFCCAYE